MNSQNIIQQYCNAVATYYGCAGHGKAARNEQAAKLLKAKAEKLGLTVPPEWPDAAKAGVFNGPGAV